MAIVIQQLTNVVNIIDDTLPAGSQIITSIELSSTAQLQLKGGSVPNVLQFFDDEGNQTANISIAPDLATQDFGGVPTVWAGTDDELVNKMNDVYLTGSGGGGSGDLTTIEAALTSIINKQDEPCSGNPQNVKDCLTLATPLRYYIQFDSLISTPFDVIGEFEIVYIDNNGIEQTFTDGSDLDSNSPYADAAALITAMNNLSGCPVTFGELTPLDTGIADFAIEVLDGTVAAANVIEVDGIEVDGVGLNSILQIIYPSLTGFDYVAQQIRNLTTDFNALGTKLDSIDNKLKSSYIGRSFSLVASSGTPFSGFPFSIERVNIIYNGGVSETVDIEPSGQQLGDIIDVANLLNEYIEGLNFDKFKQSDFNLIFSNGDKIAADVLGFQFTLTGGAGTLQYTTFTSISEDNESELTEARTLLEQIRNNSDADKYNNWSTRVNKSKVIAYYSGVAAGNPSGNKNIESITFFDSGNPVLKQTFEYDLQDDVILQGAVKP